MRSKLTRGCVFLSPLILLFVPWPTFAAEVPVDLSGFRASNETGMDRNAVDVLHEREQLHVTWPMAANTLGRLSFNLRPGEPLLKSIGVIAGFPDRPPRSILSDLDPVFFVTVGSRENPPGRPPGMGIFNVFFDSPASRPHQNFAAKLDLRSARVTGGPDRATISFGNFSAGPFKGELRFMVYAGTKLFRVEAAMSTSEENRAFLYDAGLVSRADTWKRIAWHDTEGKLHQERFSDDSADTPRAVRHRAIAAEGPGGSVACFPPPHQFFFPRDDTDNQKTVWSGKGHRGKEDRTGFGIRQTETGGGRYVPWFNAPPGSEQKMGVFFLITHGPGGEALAEALRFTHGDRFPDLPGHVTFTSHWHMAIAMAALKEKAESKFRSTPDFVAMFKEMNVRIVHLAEFHGDGHPNDPGPIRLAEMAAMFEECRRLSDDRLVFLPGEEANVHFRASKPVENPGHWLYLFPRPVYWTMKRGKDQPFVEEDPRYGKVYHVGDEADMTRLIDTVEGLAWTAHPRIKASNWAPDAYRDQPFFQNDLWLGGAWKAMPADLGEPRLGRRVLDLLDDMANWGHGKYVPGEVDVFKVDHTHELYGHMNVNYLRLDRAPKYGEDWSPVLDCLRQGKFFVTTGEVLLTEFTAGEKSSGENLSLPADNMPEIKVSLEWTFPLNFVEIISGDGDKVYRERIDLSGTRAFGRRNWTFKPLLKGRKWVRVEAWDVAANGTFSQPVWIGPSR